MKTFALIIVCLGTLLLLSSCISALEFGGDKELDKLADEYGGVYVFDKKFREEIIQREKEIKEAYKKMTLGDTFFEQKRAIDKTLPQTLSNGCEYFISNENKKGQDFRFKGEKEFEFYENKFKEFMGNEIYKKLEPYLAMSSYYECQGKRYPITFELSVSYVVTSYGLYGDEGRGFYLSKGRLVAAGTKPYANTFYLINGKFIEYDELNKQKDIK